MNQARAAGGSPLEGLRVLDFSVSVAGPFISTYLGGFGAEVVKVETSLKPDILRMSTPYKDELTGTDRSGLFSYVNSNKFSMALDMNHPRKHEVAESLIKWADVMIDNFTVGVKERWGLDYPQASRINPRIIMLSTSSQGQTGPHCQHPGWGWSMKSLCGFTHMTGWPDRDGTSPASSYTDEVAPWFAVAAILASLDWRRRTGKGQYIDHSQVEASLQFLSPALLDWTANGRRQTRQGNLSSRACPHGCYRCLGEDRWCVIAVFSNEEWESLCRAMGDPAWTRDPRFATLSSRKENEEELNQLIEAWSIGHTPEEVMTRLQSAGVAAGIVQDEEDIIDRDPHLKFREHFPWVEHPVMGSVQAIGFPFKLSRSPARAIPAPCLGEHTEKICTEFLGMPVEEFIDLFQSGVFT
ncbi:MAG: CoA transferase [Dehalococcoidia bacterium]|nr:CoA transferase [Dehalococcoidia bacterium]